MWTAFSPETFAADGKALLNPIRKAAQAEIQTAATASEAKKVELIAKYVAALTTLEKSLAASGNLDVILHVREERTAVEQTGSPTAHTDKELVELRSKYEKSLGLITAGLQSARERLVVSTTIKIKKQETALTKAGKVDDAIAVRQEGKQLLAELSQPENPARQLFEEDPRVAERVAPGALEKIEIPTEKPIENPFGNPFAEPGGWLESQTIPVSKLKIRHPIVIGNRNQKKSPLIVIAPGSVWAGSDPGRIEVTTGKLLATKCRFETLEFGGDLGSRFYFQHCAFVGSRVRKIGGWFGKDLGSRFYFENCYIKDSFADKLNIVDHGVRVEMSVFEDVVFPSMNFRKFQPAQYVRNPWLRIANSRFVDCTLPLSVLLLTRDCFFESCTFVNDNRNSDEAPVTLPMETILYTINSKSTMTNIPAALNVIEKPLSAYQGLPIPTATALKAFLPE